MNSENMRLQKYISAAGVTSRRKAEELITQGKVIVNGKQITKLGTLVTSKDTVLVDGVPANIQSNKTYILLNKPEGYVTTLKDHFDRKIVTDLLTDVKERVFPVGRLDYNTSGLLILTNDGDFANMIMHPSSEIEKEYLVKINKRICDDHIALLMKGFKVDDYFVKPKSIKILTENPKNSYISVTLIEGRNREVRKIFETLGYRVQKLKRVRISDLQIDFLKKGHYRYLSDKEVTHLKNLCK